LSNLGGTSATLSFVGFFWRSLAKDYVLDFALTGLARVLLYVRWATPIAVISRPFMAVKISVLHCIGQLYVV
jgi:hypothetical protein